MQIHSGFSEIRLVHRNRPFISWFSYCSYKETEMFYDGYHLEQVNFPIVLVLTALYSFFLINAKNILDSRKRKQLSRKRKQSKVVNSPIVYIFSLIIKEAVSRYLATL